MLYYFVYYFNGVGLFLKSLFALFSIQNKINLLESKCINLSWSLEFSKSFNKHKNENAYNSEVYGSGRECH